MLHIGQAQHGLVEGGYAGDEVAFVLGYELGVALGGEAGHENAPSALGQHRVDADAETEAVEDGHGGQHLVPGTEHRVGGDDLLGEGVEVAVGEHDALGGAGGAAGVEDDCGIVVAALDLIVVEAALGQLHELLPADDRSVVGNLGDFVALCDHVAGLQGLRQLVLDAGEDDVYDAGVLADGLDLAVELVEGDDGDAVRLVEVELDLLLARERMHHAGNASDEVDGIEHVDRLGAVGHGDGHAVALADADGLQGAGALLYVLDHPGVGGGLAHEVERHVLGPAGCDGGDHVEHRALKVVQMHGHTLCVRVPRRLYGVVFRHIDWL